MASDFAEDAMQKTIDDERACFVSTVCQVLEFENNTKAEGNFLNKKLEKFWLALLTSLLLTSL